MLSDRIRQAAEKTLEALESTRCADHPQCRERALAAEALRTALVNGADDATLRSVSLAGQSVPRCTEPAPAPAFLEEPLRSVTYMSTARQRLDDEGLVALLETSRTSNAAVSITGLLLYADGHFIQTIEGPESVVRERFAAISQDHGHRSIDVMLDEQRRSREFGLWYMGYERPAELRERPAPENFTTFLEDGTWTPPAPGSTSKSRARVFHEVFRKTVLADQLGV